MTETMQIIGICRFSYPAQGGFQIEHSSLKDRCAFLYHPARMKERFRFFETVCLPGIKAQTDSDFTFLIGIGESLPDHYKQKLQNLLHDIPQALLVTRPSGPHRQVMQAVLNHFQDTKRPSVQFRHDDDDAVAVDYVAKLRETVADCQPYLTRHRRITVDFNRGFTARLDAHGVQAKPIFRPHLGVALAMAVMPEIHQTVMNFQHNKMPQFMPTVTRSDPDMFVRCHGNFNDSDKNDAVQAQDLSYLDAAGERHFKQRFAIACKEIRSVFSSHT